MSNRPDWTEWILEKSLKSSEELNKSNDKRKMHHEHVGDILGAAFPDHEIVDHGHDGATQGYVFEHKDDKRTTDRMNSLKSVLAHHNHVITPFSGTGSTSGDTDASHFHVHHKDQ